MWQTDGGARQSTRRGGPSITEDLQTERDANAVWPVNTSFCIMLTTNSSYDEGRTAKICGSFYARQKCSAIAAFSIETEKSEKRFKNKLRSPKNVFKRCTRSCVQTSFGIVSTSWYSAILPPALQLHRGNMTK